MPLAYYFHLDRQEQNDHFGFGGIFVAFPKLQMILFSILLLFIKSALNYLVYRWVISDFDFQVTKNVNKQNF